MKKSAILRVTLLAALCAVAIRLVADAPFEVKTNWFAMVPTVPMCAALVGVIIRKEWTAAEAPARNADAELAAVGAGTPLAGMSEG